ncbi:hypothetical protein [Hymenobacter psychrotolerans]|uniref:hypothetical protein n=1 Tax=Hymenobacter psychrotolerans TaxID=344998 RepID=UPI00147CCC7D|nr:hypothetical protein [Hymenobacter psychrotolerans]
MYLTLSSAVIVTYLLNLSNIAASRTTCQVTNLYLVSIVKVTALDDGSCVISSSRNYWAASSATYLTNLSLSSTSEQESCNEDVNFFHGLGSWGKGKSEKLKGSCVGVPSGGTVQIYIGKFTLQVFSIKKVKIIIR